jgi:hypothetical protein
MSSGWPFGECDKRLSLNLIRAGARPSPLSAHLSPFYPAIRYRNHPSKGGSKGSKFEYGPLNVILSGMAVHARARWASLGSHIFYLVSVPSYFTSGVMGSTGILALSPRVARWEAREWCAEQLYSVRMNFRRVPMGTLQVPRLFRKCTHTT